MHKNAIFHNLDFQLSVLMFLMMEFQYIFSLSLSLPLYHRKWVFFLLFASHSDKHFKCIFVFKLDFSQHFFFHYRMFHPHAPVKKKRKQERKEVLLMLWFLRPRFLLLFITFLFFVLRWYDTWEFFFSFLYFCLRINRRMFRSSRQKKNPPHFIQKFPSQLGEVRKKNLFYFIIDWIFLAKQKKTHIYAVVNRFCWFLVCFGRRSFTLHNCWPVLYDAFSSLWCLVMWKENFSWSFKN